MTWEQLVEKVKDVAVNPPYNGKTTLRIGNIYFYKDGAVLTGDFFNHISYDKMYFIITALTTDNQKDKK